MTGASPSEKKQEDLELDIFLTRDAVGCAVKGQSTPDGYYNVERMLRGVIRKGAAVHLCTTCMDARGISVDDVVEGPRPAQ